MKKTFMALFTMLFVGTCAFAQSDLQVLAVVKYNKSESITLKQVKKRVGIYEKQLSKKLSLDDKKEVLNTMIGEKLIVQAAAKDGFTIPDSVINQYYEAYVSQLVGAPVTEKQFEEFVTKETGLTVDQFFEQNVGISKAEYKDNIRTQLTMQQYIIGKNQEELQKVAPTDEQIRMFYEERKATFVWNDMAKLLLVRVPLDGNEGASKIKATELRDNLANKKITPEQLKIQGTKENSGYETREVLVEKTADYAKALGLTYKSFLELLSNPENFVSELIEVKDDSWQFVSILKKYDAKMLGLSDLKIPETTVTVYDWIKQGLTQQLQMLTVQQKLVETAAELQTEDNVIMKKTGAELDKLLNWGE